jgi:uncharacterized protein YqjF (DUF2071 family)
MVGGVVKRAADVGEWLLSPTAGVVDAVAQSRTLEQVEHRPWPLPERQWLMGQTWERLLFAHWPVPVTALRRVLPEPLPIDTFEGTAWLGITPFEVSGLRPRGTPPIPGLSRFPELNVRTYTTVGGRGGIWFLSLDAGSRLAVAAARRAYRLPYFRAEMAIRAEGDEVDYTSRRVSGDGPPAAFAARYRPDGPAFEAEPGSLEHWLAERYCLYTVDERHRVHRADIHHPPWPLQPATAAIAANTMADPQGVTLPRREPWLHYAHRQDVVIWPLRVVS